MTVITADGAELRFSYDESAGADARLVVLVHGITEDRRTWDPIVPRLAGAGYRVVAVDLRGHGESSKLAPYDLATMAGDLATVLAGLDGGAEALLVGHSLGGAVVSACATAAPCRGVVDVDQPLALGEFQAALQALEPLLRGTPDEFGTAIAAIFDQMAGPLAGAERQRVESIRSGDQDVVMGVWDIVLTAPPAELEATVDALAGAIRAPYLSLHGIDPGPAYGQWLHDRIPQAVFEVWPDHGHYPHLVDPDRFVERVVAFDT